MTSKVKVDPLDLIFREQRKMQSDMNVFFRSIRDSVPFQLWIFEKVDGGVSESKMGLK